MVSWESKQQPNPQDWLESVQMTVSTNLALRSQPSLILTFLPPSAWTSLGSSLLCFYCSLSGGHTNWLQSVWPGWSGDEEQERRSNSGSGGFRSKTEAVLLPLSTAPISLISFLPFSPQVNLESNILGVNKVWLIITIILHIDSFNETGNKLGKYRSTETLGWKGSGNHSMDKGSGVQIN